MTQEGPAKTNQELPLTSSEEASDLPLPEYNIPIPILVEQLHLAMFDAAQGELSLCNGDETCLYYAKQIKSWRCATSVCDGEGTGILPTACFEGFTDKYSKNDLALINEAICPFIKSSTTDTRQVLSSRIPNGSDNSLAEVGAYLLAQKGSADLCQESIKKYVGDFGPNWHFKWFRALSGCKILAGKSTREQEEKDYHTWFVKQQGMGDCSKIMNGLLRDACNNPNVPTPKPGYELLPEVDTATIQFLLDSLQLKKFQATKLGDSTICKEEKPCSEMIKHMKYWVCAKSACEGGDNGKEPASCFDEFLSKSSTEVRSQFSKLVCPLIQSPGADSRKSFGSSNFGSDIKEDGIVQDMAYLMAIKGSAKECQEHIKDYVGSYGPNWKPIWYSALSGCRILAGESTFEQEENDFYIWFSVVDGANNCSSIMNPELRAACNTPGITSPKPVYEK